MKYILQAYGKGAENLNSFNIDTSQNYSIIIGRNLETGLDKACDHVQHVSRSHVAIHVRNNRVYMDAIARQDNIVFVNDVPCARGERELNVDDKISLLGTIGHFNYKLIKSNESSTQSKKRKVDNSSVIELIDDEHNHKSKQPTRTYSQVISLMSSSSSDKGNTPTNNAPVQRTDILDRTFVSHQQSESAPAATNAHAELIKGLLTQYECSICFDTMAGACNLSPCGDSFCFSCIEDWAKNHNTCPLCSGNFQLKFVVPSKVIDNAVREILKNENDQLADWEKRVEAGNNKRKEYLANAAAAPAKNSNVRTGPQARHGNNARSGGQRAIDDIVDLTRLDNAANSNNNGRNRHVSIIRFFCMQSMFDLYSFVQAFV